MTAVSVVFDGTRLDDADAGGNWDELDSAKLASTNEDFFYQGAASISIKVTNKVDGLEYESTSQVNHDSSNPKVVIYKGLVSTPGILAPLGSTGLNFRTGIDQNNYHMSYIHGTETYPPKESWLIVPIDPDLTAFRDETVGSPTSSNIDYYAIQASMTASPKDTNLAIDALDYVDAGKGLTLTGGDGADTDGTFQDYVDLDEGTAANRWGVVHTKEDVLYVTGTLTVGTTLPGVLTDSNQTVVFTGGRVSAGHDGLSIDLQSSLGSGFLASCNFIGKGQSDRKQFFDSSASVDAGSDFITTEDPHRFITANEVLYSKEGGSANTGLADSTAVFVNAISSTTFSLHATRQDAVSDTSRIDVFSSGTPENHSFTRQPDTRPNLTIFSTGSTDGTYTSTGCTYDSFALLSMIGQAGLESCVLINSGQVSLSAGSLTDCTISAATVTEGVGFIESTTISNISGCSFTAGDEGHAITVTSTEAPAFNDQIFTSYWNPTVGASTADNGWNFVTSSGVDGSSDIIITEAAHDFTTGDAVFYNKEGGSAEIGLTDGNKYYVNVIDTTNLSAHRSRQNANAGTNKIDLVSSSTEAHSLYSGKAALFNESGGVVDISITSGSSPSVRNSTGSATTITNTVTLTVTVLDEASAAIEDARVAIYSDPEGPSETELMNELTNASGVATEAFNFTTDTVVSVRVRKGTGGDTKYFPVNSTQTIDSGGLTVTITMIEDTINTS